MNTVDAGWFIMNLPAAWRAGAGLPRSLLGWSAVEDTARLIILNLRASDCDSRTGAIGCTECGGSAARTRPHRSKLSEICRACATADDSNRCPHGRARVILGERAARNWWRACFHCSVSAAGHYARHCRYLRAVERAATRQQATREESRRRQTMKSPTCRYFRAICSLASVQGLRIYARYLYPRATNRDIIEFQPARIMDLPTA